MLNFFWPTAPVYDPGILGRLGRLVHWLAILLWIALLAFALFGLTSTDSRFAWGLIGVAVALAGRGLRYVMAGE
jgi:hypothetical protein